MWHRKAFPWMLALAMLAGEVAVHASGFRPKGVTMLVVPARYSVLQVAFDILSKRDAVLVAYQGDPTSAEPLLHAWDGREWVYVTMEKYRDLGFLDLTPSQVVLVGDESLLPPSLIDASGWSPQVMNVPFIDTAALVNSFGQLFSFRRSDWQWFAGRYNLNLSDLNEEQRRSSWYDQRSIPEAGKTPQRKRDAWRDKVDTVQPADVVPLSSAPATDSGPAQPLEGPVVLSPDAPAPRTLAPAEVLTAP